MTRETLIAMLRSVDDTDRCDALLALALHDEYEDAVSVVLAHVHDPVLRHLAVLCLGHIARLHHRIPVEAVAIVTAALSDPDELVRGQADNAASDIRMFARASLRDDDPSWKQWPDESGEFTFRTRFTYEELDELPGDRSSIRYFPGDRAGGQDGVLIRFQPADGDAWIGVFAFGNVDGAALTQVLGMPDDRKLCVIARGAGYIANADDANDWELVKATPVVDVRVVPTERLVVFASHTDLIAYGEHGVAWRTKRLAWDGFTIVSIDGRTLCGELRDVRTDTMRQFVVDLRTGQASHDLDTGSPNLHRSVFGA